MDTEKDLKEVKTIKKFKEITTTFHNDKICKDISIMHISDIHYSGIDDKTKLVHLYNKIREYNIDYICITGDLIDSNNIIEKSINSIYLNNWLKKLTNVSKVFISLGNHDISTRISNDLRNCRNKGFWKNLGNIENLYVLDNSYYSDNNVYIYGYTQSFNYYYKRKSEDKTRMLKEIHELGVIDSIPNNKLKICMIHSPICLNDKNIKESLSNYDLIICGHMHNGMVLPIFDEIFDNNVGLIAPNKKLFPRMARGIIKSDSMIVISPGITKFHITTSPLLRWANILFPIGINKINITREKCNITKSYKYRK